MRTSIPVRFASASLLLALLASTTVAQTSNAGTPVVGAHPFGEAHPTLVRDGYGRAYVGFRTPEAPGGPINVARLLADATPDPAWTPARADLVAPYPGTPTLLVVVGDGLVWAVSGLQHTSSAFKHFMQRMEPSGPSEPPVLASRTPNFTSYDQMMHVIAQPDGHALVVHVDNFEPGLLLNRVDPSGVNVQSTIDTPFSASDWKYVGAPVDVGGGEVIATTRTYSSGQTYYDLRAVKLLADGTPAWPSVWRTICVAPGSQEAPVAAPDGAGGAYFAWTDHRSPGTGPDVYATHLLADGSLAPGWPATGRALAAVAGVQSDPRLVADGAGGGWAVWTDARTGVYNVFFTHLGADGLPEPGFGTTGRPLSNDPASRASALAVPDGAGGFFAVWRDGRNGPLADVYGQHIMLDGSVASGLAPDGEPICTNAADQLELALADVGFNAAIVAWRDNRTGADIVYAAPVPKGQSGLGVPARGSGHLALSAAGPNPAHGALECLITSTEAAPVVLRLLDAQGRVRESQTVEPSAAGIRVRFARVEPGLYFVSATQPGETRSRRFVILD